MKPMTTEKCWKDWVEDMLMLRGKPNLNRKIINMGSHISSSRIILIKMTHITIATPNTIK